MMVMAIMGCVGAVGVMFAILIFHLDRRVQTELGVGDEEERWTSII